jgi:hypothetical protein
LQTYLNESDDLQATIQAGDYTSGSWDAWSDAYDAIQAVIDDTSEEHSISEAFVTLDELSVAKNGLVSIKELSDAVAIAADLEMTDYDSEAAIEEFEDSLEAAEAVIADGAALKADVDAALADLTSALAVLNASTKIWSVLDGVVTAADQVKLDIAAGDYLAVNVPAFEAALAAAKAVQDDPASAQSEINAAAADLNASLANLVSAERAGVLAAADEAAALLEPGIALLLTPEELAEFEDAYTDVVTVLYDQSATPAQIDAAMNALETVREELGLVPADGAAIQRAVDNGVLKASDYADAALFAAYTGAYDALKALAGNSGVLQIEANKALAALQTARNALNAKQKSSSSLTTAIASYKAQLPSLREKYVASDVDFFEKMIADAEKVAASPDSTQEQIDAAISGLDKAIAILKSLADKTQLAATIAQADKIVQRYYTDKSLIGFVSALTAAKLVNANKNLSAADQPDIDAANTQLTASISKLVYNVTKMTVSKSVKNKLKKLKKNRTLQLKVSVTPKAIQKQVTLKYKSNKTKVATVSKTGKIKAKKKGTATITVTAPNGRTLKIKVTVK